MLLQRTIVFGLAILFALAGTSASAMTIYEDDDRGTTSALVLSESAWDFGTRPVGAPVTGPLVLVISNGGALDLTFGEDAVSILGSGAAHFDIVTDTAEAVLAGSSAETRTVTVAFEPTGPGNRAATLTVEAMVDGMEVTGEVALSGRGENAPYVVSLEPRDPAPTNSPMAEWRLTFSEPVEGVEPGSFRAYGTGLAEPSVADLYPAGASAYYVTVARGTATVDEPELRLDLLDDGTISAGGRPLIALTGSDDGSTSGTPYTFDLVAPQATLTLLTTPSPTSADAVEFRLDADKPLAPTVGGGDFFAGGTLPPGTVVTVGPPAANGAGDRHTITATFASPDIDGRFELSTERPALITNGLIARYDFREGAGRFVRDTSGVEPALDLEIADRERVRWLPGGGIEILQPTLIASAGPASKLYDILAGGEEPTNAITVEAFVVPASATQEGPARIATMSDGSQNRNFTLGQEADQAVMRLRTTSTGANGLNPATIADDQFALEEVHVLYTRGTDGTGRLYVNGVLVEENDDIGGSFSNWDEDMRFGLANEFGEDRDWRGRIHGVSIYSRALSATEAASQARAAQFLRDAAGNEPAAVEAEVLIDNGPPRILGITRLDPPRIRSGNVRWLVEFNDDVVGVDLDSFQRVNDSSLPGSIFVSVVPEGTSQRRYIVTVDPGPGEGQLRLDLHDTTGIMDVPGNALTETAMGEAYFIDRTGPSLLAIRRVHSTPTRRLEVDYRLEFNEPVLGLAPSDLELTAIGMIDGERIIRITQGGSPSAYLVTVDTGDFDGRLTLAPSESFDVTDTAFPGGNPLVSGTPSVIEFYTVDKNDAPVDVFLTTHTVVENVPVGTLVGEFMTTDFDVLDTHTYTFVPPYGNGGGLFAIANGDQLVTAAEIDYESVPRPLLISVRATDNGADTEPPTGLASLFVEEVLTIIVVNVVEGSEADGWFLR